MPQRPDEELIKITLNIYKKDKEELQKLFGHGWSDIGIRQMIRKFLNERRRKLDE